MRNLIGRVHPRGQRCPDRPRIPAPTQLKAPRAAQAELVICDYTIERTFAWLGQARRLSKDYERLPETGEAMIHAAMSRLMLRRLAQAA